MTDARLGQTRDRLLALQARRDAGSIAEADYAAARAALERELGEAVLAAAIPPTRTRPSARLVGGVAALVVAVGVAGYALTGAPTLAGAPARTAAAGAAAGTPSTSADTGADAATPAAERQAGLQQIAGLVDKLAARLKDRPDDAEGWTMLARSYTVLGRFADAVPAYRRAVALKPRDAALLADFADVTGALQGRADNPESATLLAQALALEPDQPKALALAGTAAFDRGDYAVAAATWQRMVDTLPAGSDMRKQAEASIAEAREKAGGAGSAGRATTAPAGIDARPAIGRADAAVAAAGADPRATAAADPRATAAGATASGSVPPAASGPGAVAAARPDAVAAARPDAGPAAGAVSGTVTLDPALASRAHPDDAVFVFARATEGGRMPLAVRRARVADLPLRFTLDDSMAMMPSARLSLARSVIVGARISKSGNALPQPGDLAGEAAPVAPGATGLAIRIATVVAGG